MVATRAVRSAILIGREAWTLNGHIGSTGNGIIIGAEGITMMGADRSEPIIDESSETLPLIVDANPDTGVAIAPSVILGEGQIRRLRIIAWHMTVLITRCLNERRRAAL